MGIFWSHDGIERDIEIYVKYESSYKIGWL